MPTINPVQSALTAAQAQEAQKPTQLNTGPKPTPAAKALPQDQVTISPAARQAQTLPQPQTLQSQQAKPSIASNNDTDQTGEGH